MMREDERGLPCRKTPVGLCRQRAQSQIPAQRSLYANVHVLPRVDAAFPQLFLPVSERCAPQRAQSHRDRVWGVSAFVLLFFGARAVVGALFLLLFGMQAPHQMRSARSHALFFLAVRAPAR